MNIFTAVFVIMVLLVLATQLWLGWRQRRHIKQHRDAVPAAFAERITLAAHQKAASYSLARSRLGSVEAVYGMLVLMVWTLGGGLSALDELVRGWQADPLYSGVIFLLLLFLIGSLLDQPIQLYQTFRLEAKFGFNRTNLATWITDLLKNAAIGLLLGTPLLWAVLWLMQGMGSYWWFYVWLLWTGFALFMTWAYPVLIAPLFNKFKPLEASSTRERIESLLARTGFTSRGIFVMDGSRRSAHGNAYFTGFGRSKRIVFFDTLLKSLSDEEIEAVLAHELGHFRRRHVIKRMILMFSISLLALALLGWLYQSNWFYEGLGADRASTHMALALFILSSPVFGFYLGPLMAWGSRKHEFEADAFAAEHADAGHLIDALVRLYEENASTLTPDPVHSAFYDSHPPASIRIQHLQRLQTG